MARSEAELKALTKAQLAAELQRLNPAKYGGMASLDRMTEGDLVKLVQVEEAGSPPPKPAEPASTPPPSSGGGTTGASAPKEEEMDLEKLTCKKCGYMAEDFADLRKHNNEKHISESAPATPVEPAAPEPPPKPTPTEPKKRWWEH